MTIERTTMQELPPCPAVDAAPDVFASGHLWVEELVAGDPLRFRMTDAGFLEFGDAEGVFAHDAIPLRYRHAVRAVRESFARESFQDAVDDPASVTFVCVAVHRREGESEGDGPTPEYDWARTPSVLGTDVHDADRGRYLPRDTVQAVFERVGLPAVEPIEKELRAADVDPESYPIPDSAWYDGPAAGVVVRNKRGGRGRIVRDRLDSDQEAGGECAPAAHEPADTDDLEHLTARYVTPNRLARAAGSMERDGTPVTVGSLAERVVETVARETPVRVGDRHSDSSLDPDELRTAALSPARAFLDDSGSR